MCSVFLLLFKQATATTVVPLHDLEVAGWTVHLHSYWRYVDGNLTACVFSWLPRWNTHLCSDLLLLSVMLSCLNSGCTSPECNPPPFCTPLWTPAEAISPISTSRWTHFVFIHFNTFSLNSNEASIVLHRPTTCATAFWPWWKKLPIFHLVLQNKGYDAYSFVLFCFIL